MNAKEAEMNQFQAKTREEMDAEIKKLRKRLNFNPHLCLPSIKKEYSKTESKR
jgi:hypothetical protein